MIPYELRLICNFVVRGKSWCLSPIIPGSLELNMLKSSNLWEFLFPRFASLSISISCLMNYSICLIVIFFVLLTLQDEIFSSSFAAAMYLKVNNFPSQNKVLALLNLLLSLLSWLCYRLAIF